MHAIPEPARAPIRRLTSGAVVASLLVLALSQACGGGGSASIPADPPVTNDVLGRGQPAPGVVVAITSITGGSGDSGAFFRPGDRPRVRYTVTKSDGSPWGLGELDVGRILVSGPTFNYQRVIVEQTDLVARSVKQSDGSYLYTFAVPLPGAYEPPYNDTPAFGAGDGEMTGQPLQDGTYTVGITLGWDYRFRSSVRHDVGETVGHFKVGGSATFVTREVVGQANCNACHVELSAHEGLHKDVRVCLLCHTQGAEDRNEAGVAGGTPGVSISSRVMFHKLHNGQHQPSVLGISTLSNGRRTYTATPTPYVLVDGDTGAHDYSNVGFPVWPNRTIAMPRDFGWSALSPTEKALDERVREGITTCNVCHGDPDGDGPIAAPADGDTVYAEPSRAACGACHDDVSWDLPYDAGNSSVMPPQADDSICRECHAPVDDLQPSLAVRDSHEHPLVNPRMNPFLGQGIHLELLSVVESGANDGDGRIDVGEKIAVTMRIHDDAGVDVNPTTIGGVTAIVAGPSVDMNLVHETSIPVALLSGPQPFTLNLPERIQLELVGRSTAVTGEVFATSRAPHADVTGAATQVFARTGSGAGTVLSAAAGVPRNFVDVVDATGFARDDVIVIDDGTPGIEESMRVQFVDGNRLWFSSLHSPAYPSSLRFAHAAGSSVIVVALTPLVRGVDYALDPSTGMITELAEIGDGVAVLASYTTDFVLPASYPEAANGSPDLGDASGKWSGKPLVAGTYRVSLSAYKDFDYFVAGATTRYRASTEAASVELLFGDADVLTPYAAISSPENCYACHQELDFHEQNFRGYETCIACHGDAGAEDRPRYVSANAPATTGVTVDFRTLLHQIHRGALLDHANTFTVVGAGARNYPNDFTANRYSTRLFPAQPGSTADCAKCHGDDNQSWKQPVERDHPLGQDVSTAVWRATCGACHDSNSATAHIDVNTSASGAESCAVCHGIGRTEAVELVHDVR